jgi:hypothetical protein
MKELYNQIAFFIHVVLLDQAFAHCPKFPTADPYKEFGPCLSPNVADHSSKSAKDHWLGPPLQDQLPNPTKAHLLAINLYVL